ncbi:type I-E CRISPR-associated protein Cse2/CasB [Streptomyces sp. NPDC085665]|uniref:type I-E CRISPR-associated protein Cse2/CasB n=1 Tax=Streptomyces sp. NPDC085665 TaxID=3365735 RepID=UPI0037D97EE7
MTAPVTSHTPGEAGVEEDAPFDVPSEQRLTRWLAGCLRSGQYDLLVDLRKGGTRADSRARLFADCDADREVFGQVAHLYAIYHRGATEPAYGYGSLGDAMGRAQAKPGARAAGFPLKLNRIVSGRAIRWRDLEKAMVTLREQGARPPAWTQLIIDLRRWHDRAARVPESWVGDFDRPFHRAESNSR